MDLDHLSTGDKAAWWVEMVPGTLSVPGAEVQNLSNVHCFFTT